MSPRRPSCPPAPRKSPRVASLRRCYHLPRSASPGTTPICEQFEEISLAEANLMLPPSSLLAVGELHSLRCNLHFPQSSHLRIRALYTLNVKNYRARGRIGSHCVVLVSRRQVPQGNFPLFFPPSFAIARCSPACKRHLHIGTTVLYHVRET